MTGANPLALLVAGALDDETEHAILISQCLGELERSRGVLSLPGLINRLWLVAGSDGYEGPAAGEIVGSLPRLGKLVGGREGPQEAESQPAVPLGAIIEVELGQRSPFYGEVVWKEGAHPALSADFLPMWLAGAPSLPNTFEPPPIDCSQEGERVLRERLVLDFSCFGASVAPKGETLTRLRSRGRWLDGFGHLVLDLSYRPGDDEDDLAFWATWVCANSERALSAAEVEADPVVLRRVAGQLLEAMSAVPSVRAFGPYLVTDWRCRQLEAAAGDLYDRAAHSMAHVHRSQVRSWTSMSLRLAEVDSDSLVGVGWPDNVLAASLHTLDLLAKEAPDGNWMGVHLRLDDAWQGGGIWRAEVLGEVPPLALDPSLALGLGWLEYTGRLDATFGEIPAPEWLETAEAGLAGVNHGETEEGPLAWDIKDSAVRWIVHVTARDIDAQRLQVPPRVQELVRAALDAVFQTALVTWIHHDGEVATHMWGPPLPSGHLQVTWPPSVRAGTTFTAVWYLEGHPVVRAYSQLLPDPVVIDGVSFLHEFHEPTALAALGLVERHRQVVTLERLIRAAVRHYGTLAPDGRWCLEVAEICDKCFGPEGEVAPRYPAFILRRAVDSAIQRMVVSSRAARQGDLVLVAESTTSSIRFDRELLDRYLEGRAQRLRSEAARAWVGPSVVNLPTGWRASPEKIASWPEVAGTDRLPEGELGRHRTWRRGHVRGVALSPAIEQALEREVRSAATLGASPEQLERLREAARSDPTSDSDRTESETT